MPRSSGVLPELTSTIFTPAALACIVYYYMDVASLVACRARALAPSMLVRLLARSALCSFLPFPSGSARLRAVAPVSARLRLIAAGSVRLRAVPGAGRRPAAIQVIPDILHTYMMLEQASLRTGCVGVGQAA